MKKQLLSKRREGFYIVLPHDARQLLNKAKQIYLSHHPQQTSATNGEVTRAALQHYTEA